MSRRKRQARAETEGADRPVFVLDECIPRGLAKKLTCSTAKFVPMPESLRGARDHEWIPEVAKQDHLIVTKDKRILRRTSEREALMESRAGVFVITSNNLSVQGTLNLLLSARDRMARAARSHTRPFIAKISGKKRAEVEMIHGERRGAVKRRPRRKGRRRERGS